MKKNTWISLILTLVIVMLAVLLYQFDLLEFFKRLHTR